MKYLTVNTIFAFVAACIGVGGKEFDDIRNVMSENIVAICDVDTKHAAEATLFVGSKGMLIADYGRFKLFPEDRFESVRRPKIARKPSHTDDWVEACKTNDPLRPGTNFSYAGPLTETVLLGIVAYRAGEKISWDAKNLKITNNPQAERFIRRDKYRKGWTL